MLGQLDEFGIATGAEREELEYQRQVWVLSLSIVAFGVILSASVFIYLYVCFSFSVGEEAV